MPKPISDEELQLKVRARRRILGAVALVVTLVLVLPMVLDSQPKRDAEEVAIRIPAQEKASPFNPPLKPVAPRDMQTPAEKPVAPVVKPLTDVKPGPVGAPVNDVAKPSSQELKPLSKPIEKPTHPQKTPETPKLANPKPGKFAVQLGVFSNPANAQQVEEMLKENKIRHYREVLKSPPGAVRVRAGPYPSRGEAEGALARLKLAGIAGGVVVSE
ncbi:MAG TPA: SPOR domain-containing protein [Burkholderiales bacterium]|nr:SPOR domain-containing protein [Burkholderiales bacterium]